MAPIFLELIAKEMDEKRPQPSAAGTGGRKDDDEEKPKQLKTINNENPK
jgi:hypothetical protein